MRAWRVHRYGRPSEALELDDIDPPKPGPGQLLVRARSTVLNFNDVDGCYGRYLTIHPPLPYTLGMEVVGDVEAAGPGAEAWIGRRVISTAVGATGAYAEQALIDHRLAVVVPEGWDYAQAAAVVEVFCTAGETLFGRGELQSGESILVHAGGSGVGVYLAAALLLDLHEPHRIVGKSSGPILAPETDYEQVGFVPNVVFPTGVVDRGDTLLLYYGAADTVCAVAELSKADILAATR